MLPVWGSLEARLLDEISGDVQRYMQFLLEKYKKQV
jgi:hypothetical protein